MQKLKNYNDLNESDIFCRFQNYEFYFSSYLRMEKFKDNFESYAKNEALKLIYRYDLNIDFESLKLMFIFSYYTKIEKRGFRVIHYFDNIKQNEYNEKPLFMITGVVE